MTAAQPNNGQGPLTWIRRRLPVEALLTGGVLLLLWVWISRITPDFVLPPLEAVLETMLGILTDAGLFHHAMVTLLRVIAGLVGAFLVGSIWGLIMGWSRRIDKFSMPILQITQGVPSLSWVVIAIIWFQSVELRIWFILVVVTLPGFAFQALDSYRAIPRELRDMARSLRPRRFDMFRTLTVPSVAPDLLTAWKINLGLGTRVVLVAELVGAPVGVGFQLLVRQQRFDMAGVIAWTGVLVVFVIIVQKFIERVERRLLRYRPGEGGEPVVAEAPPAEGDQIAHPPRGSASEPRGQL